MSVTFLPFAKASEGYAGKTLAAVKDLSLEEQMAEIDARVVVGIYAGIDEFQLNVLRRYWELLYARLYGLPTYH